MKTLIIPPSAGERILPFYLAAEEWAAMCLDGNDDWFFAWQVAPTVICGRHQDMPLEVDMDYARSHGIQVWRRKSGGGCVYADRHNVMFSCITSGDGDVQRCFDRYTGHICRMLGEVGINAEPTGRNDIAVGGLKVAGNAFYRCHGRSIVHGTMLYDVDTATMGRVLTPSRAKLMSKGVQSVPARITTLRRCGLAMDCGEFVSHAMTSLSTGGAYTLSGTDLARVEEIMQDYLQPGYLQRDGLRRLPLHASRRIEGVGEVCLSMAHDADGRIAECRLSGDFFGSQQAKTQLCARLRGVRPDRGSLVSALDGCPVGEAVEGLDTATFIDLITETTIP